MMYGEDVMYGMVCRARQMMYGQDIMYLIEHMMHVVQSTAPDKPNLHLAKVEDLEKELAKRKEVFTRIPMHSCMLYNVFYDGAHSVHLALKGLAKCKEVLIHTPKHSYILRLHFCTP